MIDLKPFCATEPTGRHYFLEPVSRGDFTYATDGRILVRVPRRSDVAEMPDAPDMERPFPKPGALVFRPVQRIELPPSGLCKECAGRGTQHDSPCCCCDCEVCDGLGELGAGTSLQIGGELFGLTYVALLLSLPDVEVAASNPTGDYPVLEFRFAGGDGVMVGLSSKHSTHLDIDLAPITEGATP